MGRVGSPEHPGLASGLPKPGGEISRSRNGGKAASQPPPSVESYGRTRTHFVVFPGTLAMEARRAFGFSVGSGSPFNGPDRAVVATLQSLVHRLLLSSFPPPPPHLSSSSSLLLYLPPKRPQTEKNVSRGSVARVKRATLQPAAR